METIVLSPWYDMLNLLAQYLLPGLFFFFKPTMRLQGALEFAVKSKKR